MSTYTKFYQKTNSDTLYSAAEFNKTFLIKGHMNKGTWPLYDDGVQYTLYHYNVNNNWEQPYSLNDAGYWLDGEADVKLVKKGTGLEGVADTYTVFYSDHSTFYLVWGSDNNYYLSTSSSISNWFKKFSLNSSRIVVVLQAGGAGGGAPYQVSLFEGHDGAGGGGGGCAIFVLNLNKIKNSTNYYKFEIGSGGGRSGPGFGSQGGAGNPTKCYINSTVIAIATGGTGGVKGTGGAGGEGKLIKAYTATTTSDTAYLYKVPGVTYYSESDSTYGGCWGHCTAGRGKPQGNRGEGASQTIYASYTTNGAAETGSSSNSFSGNGGASNNSNSGGGGGGSYFGNGGRGGSNTAEAGLTGYNGGGGGGARWTISGKEGGPGGPGLVYFCY